MALGDRQLENDCRTVTPTNRGAENEEERVSIIIPFLLDAAQGNLPAYMIDVYKG